MGLQLSVRHAADVVIVDLHGKATIGRANDFLDSQLQQLIEVGTSKLLINLTDVTQLDVPTVAGAIPLVRDDLHGLCGGVLGRNDTLRGVPTRLQVLTGRPAGR